MFVRRVTRVVKNKQSGFTLLTFNYQWDNPTQANIGSKGWGTGVVFKS